MIAIVDYGMGNLLSVAKAFEFLGKKVQVTTDQKEIQAAEKLVLPGVGAFGDAASELKKRGLLDPVLSFTKSERPILGVCLGLQLFLAGSEESPDAEGLGVLTGGNKLFCGSPFEGRARLKVPHIGWNSLSVKKTDCPLLKGIQDGDFFYFVHSYYANPDEREVVAAETEYGISFPSVLWSGNIFATQFHPEKSQKCGLTILKNFAEL